MYVCPTQFKKEIQPQMLCRRWGHTSPGGLMGSLGMRLGHT